MRVLRSVLAGLIGIVVTMSVVLVGPTTARALPSNIDCSDHPQTIITGYGRLIHCLQISGTRARVGLWSVDTGTFLPSTGWMPLRRIQDFIGYVRANGESTTFAVFGLREVLTPYGWTYFGTQVQDNWYYGPLGRLGNVNQATGLFYPSSDWFPLVP